MLARIRNLPGFSEFLKPTKSTSLCNAATSGPVVVVNAHKTRCDALILVPHSSEVSPVHLPALRLSEVQGMQHQWAQSMRGAGIIQRHYAPDSEASTTLVDILGRCWSDMVEPILGHLKVRNFVCAVVLKALIADIVTWKAHGPPYAAHYVVPNWASNFPSYSCCWPLQGEGPAKDL